AVSEAGKGVVLITPGRQCEYADVYERQPRAGRPFTYPLFARPDGAHLETVELHEKGVADGARVWPQVTPRPLTMQFTIADPYIANDDTDAVGRLLTTTSVALGLSDAGAHVDQLCDAPLFTDLLAKWVRERQVVSLERAVRKMTGEPADMFGFVGRGYLREGYW